MLKNKIVLYKGGLIEHPLRIMFPIYQTIPTLLNIALLINKSWLTKSNKNKLKHNT